MPRLVLADTTVLNNFAQVGRPDLLAAAWPGLAVPRAVLLELAEGERRGLVPRADWTWLALLELGEEESARAGQLRDSLQAGEAACLALAESRGGVVLTDDGAARRHAATLGLEISGTLGVLARLVRRAILPLAEGNSLLIKMIESGYRCPIRLLSEILQEP